MKLSVQCRVFNLFTNRPCTIVQFALVALANKVNSYIAVNGNLN